MSNNHPNRNKPINHEDVVKLRGNLTQSEVADLWKVNLRTVQRWESPNEIKPSFITFEGMKVVMGRYLENR